MKKDKLTRRDFLKVASITTAGLALSACGLGTTKSPNPTSTPPLTPFSTSTNTSIPSTPTISVTPTPENIADTKDLSVWIDNFVHAYGGNVVVNGVEMDTNQLTDEIRKNSSAFTQAKEINGINYSFLVINTVPLASRQESNSWNPITIKLLANTQGLKVGSENRITDGFFDQLNQATISGSYWKQVCPTQNVYDFNYFEGQINSLAGHNMILRGPWLLFPTVSYAMPDWLLNGNFSKEQLADMLINHVKTVITYGKSKGITEWVVVNEPFLPKYRENDIFYKSFGYDYIETAFQTAREAEPNAMLIYNDVDNHSQNGLTTALTLEIVKNLKSKGLIDAVGIEGHIGDWVKIPDPKDVELTLKSYEVPIIVTEFDYNLTKVTGSDQERYEKQAKVYRDFLTAALNINCKDFTFWGLNDSSTWLLDIGITDGASTMFDKYNLPKMAYYAVIGALFDRIN